MNKLSPSSITIEEAVARMINFDYIPTGFSLLDMTEAFQEEAEVEYENAKLDRLPEGELDAFMCRVEACKARQKLAKSLLEHIKQELNNPDDSLLVLSSDSSSMQRLELESLADWASEKYGIGIPDWLDHDAKIDLRTDNAKNEVHPTLVWNDVTIKIYKDYKLGCFIGKESREQSHFRDIGLMGNRKNLPNVLGCILVGLSRGEKFPTGTKSESKDKVALSKLRAALKQLTGISSDPFYPFNDHDGWKPIFKLIDDRKNADERAKKRATHVSYEDTKSYDDERSPQTSDFDREDDEANAWMKENDKSYQ